jgi:hypothetical protein
MVALRHFRCRHLVFVWRCYGSATSFPLLHTTLWLAVPAPLYRNLRCNSTSKTFLVPHWPHCLHLYNVSDESVVSAAHPEACTSQCWHPSNTAIQCHISEDRSFSVVTCYFLAGSELRTAGGRAYSVRWVSSGGDLFRFVRQSAIPIAVQVTRS